MRTLAFGPGIFLLLALGALPPAAAETPSWLDRWLWNPVERTARGVEAFAAGDPAAAVELLAAARRLAPSSPTARYNAGTARFAAGADDAVELLESAARAAGSGLAPAAWYNLGTARLAAGDLEEAIAALEEALRRQPGREDAKVNLELALRQLARRQASEPRPGKGDSPPPDEPPPAESQETEDPPPAAEQEPEPSAEPDSGEEGRERPLPGFRDLPDMTAEEAAAILQAVENMEREQRREDAQRTSRASSGRRKDW